MLKKMEQEEKSECRRGKGGKELFKSVLVQYICGRIGLSYEQCVIMKLWEYLNRFGEFL